ncbi:hypothetical protein [Marinicellulosiphila megalodicopiae]|uniref:hypothetical protein n=1 Tax=Marinicellulosiphila megalodicopiae TaxID=2724896 RepID=UPI003BAE97CB
MNKLTAQCFEHFEKLEHALNALSNIQNSTNQFYIPESLQHTSINNQLNDIYYQSEGDGRLSKSYWGLVGVDSKTILKLETINTLKKAFQTSVIALKTSNENDWMNIYQNINSRPSIIKQSFNLADLSRLHLKQTYRQIPILRAQPSKVSFSWYSSGRSIKRLTKQQVLEKLLNLGEDKIHIQMQINNLLSVDDSHFAQIQTQAPLIRTNILFPDQQTQAINTSLPIFFDLSDPDHFPYVSELPETPSLKRTRKVRSDSKIQTDIFLQSLRIHRYNV